MITDLFIFMKVFRIKVETFRTNVMFCEGILDKKKDDMFVALIIRNGLAHDKCLNLIITIG